jgi:hypothetical protein
MIQWKHFCQQRLKQSFFFWLLCVSTFLTLSGCGGDSGDSSSPAAGTTGNVLTSDSFSTGDTASSITTTDAALGGAAFTWIPDNGVIGISSGKAYPVSFNIGGEAKMAIETGYSNCTYSFKLSTPPTAGVFVLFIKIDVSAGNTNSIGIIADVGDNFGSGNPAAYILSKSVGGPPVLVDSVATAPNA